MMPKKKLAYELTPEELTEEVDREVKEHFKPKIPEERVPVDPQIAAKVYKCMNNPPAPIQLPSDFDRTLIKAQQRNKKCEKTVPQLGTVQKELKPLVVTKEPDQLAALFLRETGFMLEQAQGKNDDLPIAKVVAVPYKLGQPFVTEEEEMNLGT